MVQPSSEWFWSGAILATSSDHAATLTSGFDFQSKVLYQCYIVTIVLKCSRRFASRVCDRQTDGWTERQTHRNCLMPPTMERGITNCLTFMYTVTLTQCYVNRTEMTASILRAWSVIGIIFVIHSTWSGSTGGTCWSWRTCTSHHQHSPVIIFTKHYFLFFNCHDREMLLLFSEELFVDIDHSHTFLHKLSDVNRSIILKMLPHNCLDGTDGLAVFWWIDKDSSWLSFWNSVYEGVHFTDPSQSKALHT